MRHYHDDYLTLITEAALAGRNGAKSGAYKRVYSSKKGGYAIYAEGEGKSLFGPARYFLKDDADFVLSLLAPLGSTVEPHDGH